MYSSITPLFKHRLNLNVKHCPMDSKDFFSYSEAMINITEDEQERLELAARIAEALSEVPRGTKSAIALKCSINPAAVTGWLKTGRINTKHLEVLSSFTKYSLRWLITGKGDKRSVVTDKTVMELSGNSLGQVESIQSRVGGLPLNKDFPPLLDQEKARGWREAVEKNQLGTEKRMIGNTVVTDAAFKYVVRGVGMSPDIEDGDMVVVDPGLQPQDADVLLVDIAGDQSVMQLWNIAGESWLTFKNQAYADMKKPLASASVLGVVLVKLQDPIPISRR